MFDSNTLSGIRSSVVLPGMASSYYETPISVRERVAELQGRIRAEEASPETMGGYFNPDADRGDEEVSETTARSLFPRANSLSAPYPRSPNKQRTPPPPSHLGKHVRRAEALVRAPAHAQSVHTRSPLGSPAPR